MWLALCKSPLSRLKTDVVVVAGEVGGLRIYIKVSGNVHYANLMTSSIYHIYIASSSQPF
jgi:hypothetical protein